MVSFTVTRRPFCEKQRYWHASLELMYGMCAYPVARRLRNVFSNLFRGKAKGTNLWSKGG
jgi:hypothetical protein